MTEGTRPLVWRPDLEKVLIVHESAAFRAALRSKLSPAGFHCIEAGDALAGLQRAFEDRPVALVIDASLGGLDGSEMRDVLANERVTRHLPVLLCEEQVALAVTGQEAQASGGGRISAGADASGWQSVLRGLIDSAAKGKDVGARDGGRAPAGCSPASLETPLSWSDSAEVEPTVAVILA